MQSVSFMNVDHIDDDFVMMESREEVERFMANSDEKKKKKYFRQLFDFLGGGDSPIEALELALGRDKTLQKHQMSILSIFSLWADETNSAESLRVFQEKRNQLQLLSQCYIGKFVTRLILSKPKNSIGKDIGNKHLYCHCLNMLQYITDERYVDYKPERMKNFKIAQEYNLIPHLVNFLDPANGNILIMFHASAILKHFVTDTEEASILIYRAAGLRKCLHLMSRKECEKICMDYYKENYSPKSILDNDEVEIIQKFYYGKISILKSLERFPQVTEYHFRKECLMYVAREMQENCALVSYKIAASNKLVRREILLLKPFSKVLNKWFNTPCIWRTEQRMIQYAFNILRGVIEDAQPCISSRDILKNYKIMDWIEQQIFNPEKDNLISVLNLLGVFARQYPECITMIIGKKDFLKAVSIYIDSYDDQVQIGALQTICTFVQCPSTAALVLDMGITPEKFFLLSKYNVNQVTAVLKQMKIQMAINCPLEWGVHQNMFESTCLERKYNLEKAQRFKEQGNTQFKAEKYDKAIQLYTYGLNCIPPVENLFSTCTNYSKNKTTVWFVLPSALFTNRAQCYLMKKKWQEAIDDCTSAIARSFEDNAEARKILFKTVYRRARAFLEIKSYRNALHDISFCLRRDAPAANVRSLFQEILTLYRKHHGIEPLRRCGTCMEGVGTNLKRCAKCPEMYCSRACQTYAWNEGHKKNCNYSLEDENSE